MFHYTSKDLSVPEIHKLLLGGVAPRPIALVSTLSAKGKNNLSPFSFFNVFGTNPPMLAFSPSRRGRDASLKDTYNNLITTKECVVQAVTYSMVEQINLASTEYPAEVDEFIKSGLTPIDSDIVKPKRVQESPFQMECKLMEMKSYGDKGSSANMAICEILKLHVAEDIFTNGIIDPQKIDLVARMSGSFYCRASGDAIFSVQRPRSKSNIGYDQLPEFIKSSEVYSANNLAQFGNIESMPDMNSVDEFIDSFEKMDTEGFELNEEAFYRYQRLSNYNYMMRIALELAKQNHPKLKLYIELSAKCALENDDEEFAWKAALSEKKFL